MGWEPNEVRWAVDMGRLWNRILGLGTNRIVRKIFEWDILSGGAWAQNMLDILIRAGLIEHFHSKQQIYVFKFKFYSWLPWRCTSGDTSTAALVFLSLNVYFIKSVQVYKRYKVDTQWV